MSFCPIMLCTHLALEELGNITGSLGDFLGISVAFANEDEQVVLDLSAEDLLCAFVVEFNNQRQRFGLDKLDDSF